MPPRRSTAAAPATAATAVTAVPFASALLTARGWQGRYERLVAQDNPPPPRPVLVISPLAPTLVSLLYEFAAAARECPLRAKEASRLRRMLRRPLPRNLLLRRRALSRFVPQRGSGASANMQRMLRRLDLLMEAWLCWREAWNEQPEWTSVAAHSCDPGCPMWRHGAIYVCGWSGQMHECTSGACSYAVAQAQTGHMMADSRVCSITGFAYDLDFEYGFEEGVGKEDHRRVTNTQTTGKRKRKAAGGSDGMSTHNRAASMQSLVRATAEVVVEATPLVHTYRQRVDKNNQTNDVDVYLRKLFAGRDVPPDVLQRMHACVVETYTRAQTTQVYADLAPRQHMAQHPYTLQAHMISVAYGMKQGGQYFDAQHPYVPPDAWVRANLARISDHAPDVLSTKYAMQERKTTRQLNDMMREWWLKHKHSYSVSK